MNKIVLAANEEIRTEMVRLYLDQHIPAILVQLQDEVRTVTNHIVRGRQDTKNAVVAYAKRHGLCGEAPKFPEKPNFPTPVTEEDKAKVKQAWAQYTKEEKASTKEYGKWLEGIFKIVKGIPECAWRQETYQDLRKLYGKIGSAHLFRECVSRVLSTKRAKPKKYRDASIPLVWGNSRLIQTNGFYGTRRGIPFYNAKVNIPGVGYALGRLRRPLPGRPVQGVSLVKKPDGWYAAVKCIVKKKILPEPVLPPIGVDVGQTDLVALSDGYKERNIRDAEFVILKAAIQEKGDRSGDENIQRDCWSKIARLEQLHKRRITHWLNSELLPRLTSHSTVFVEKLQKNFKSNRGPLSCMHTILDAIKARLGDRVVEVDPAHTSQTCSCCGNVDKSARQGKKYTCTNGVCRVELDADINAARNILAEGLISTGCADPRTRNEEAIKLCLPHFNT